MLKMISSILTFIILFTINIYADTGDIVNSGNHTYKAVRLTPSIYNNTNENLSDILILDKNEVAVPYFINSYENIQGKYVNFKYNLNFVSSYIKDKNYISDYYIEGNDEKDLLATSINVETKTVLFAKTVKLMGSFDGVNWEYIKDDKLYRVDNTEKLSISFDKPVKYTHYRFIVLDGDKNLTFDNVSLEYNQLVVNKSFFIESLSPTFEVKQEDKTTIIELFGLKNIKINEITFETDDQFKRNFSFPTGYTKTLYNLSFENDTYKDTTLLLNGYVQNLDSVKINIENGDDTPIKVKSVTVSYFADEVVFKGTDKDIYKISYKDPSIIRPPIYDIENYKNLILKEGYDILTIDNIKIKDIKEEPNETNEKYYSIIFNTVITITSIILFFIVISNIKRSRSS